VYGRLIRALLMTGFIVRTIIVAALMIFE